jgi:hypothetical protein
MTVNIPNKNQNHLYFALESTSSCTVSVLILLVTECLVYETKVYFATLNQSLCCNPFHFYQMHNLFIAENTHSTNADIPGQHTTTSSTSAGSRRGIFCSLKISNVLNRFSSQLIVLFLPASLIINLLTQKNSLLHDGPIGGLPSC